MVLASMKQARRQPRKSLVDDARTALRAGIAMDIRLAERLITRHVEAQLRAVGLGVAEFALMLQIAAARDDTVSSLAQRLGLDQSTLSRNLRALARRGLAEIVVAEADLRRRAVWLTEKGATRLEAALPIWREADAELAGALDRRQVARIAAGAAKMTSG
jgi:DNA-binding MarR family transcriptional regulator